MDSLLSRYDGMTPVLSGLAAYLRSCRGRWSSDSLHEANNIITGAQGYHQLARMELEESNPNPREIKEKLEYVSSSLERLYGLIQRVEDPTVRRIPIRAYCQELQSELQRIQTRRGVPVRVRLADSVRRSSGNVAVMPIKECVKLLVGSILDARKTHPLSKSLAPVMVNFKMTSERLHVHVRAPGVKINTKPVRKGPSRPRILSSFVRRTIRRHGGDMVCRPVPGGTMFGFHISVR